MVWDKKTSYCIQNIFFEEGVKFYYARMLLDDISHTADVFPILEQTKATIKYGIFARIEDNKTKWSFTFTAADKIDESEFIKKLEITRAKPATTWEQDIIYLADELGYSPEYPIIGYPTLDPPNPALPIILIGGMWKRIVLSMDEQFYPEGTDIVLYNAGKAQGCVMGERLGERFQIPHNVNGINFEQGVKNLFKGYGHCDITEIEVDEGNNRVTRLLVYHSFFNYLGISEDRENSFLIGLFDGFFSTHLGTDHGFAETECGVNKINCIYNNTAS